MLIPLIEYLLFKGTPNNLNKEVSNKNKHLHAYGNRLDSVISKDWRCSYWLKHSEHDMQEES